MREHCTGIIGDVQILKAVLTGVRMIPCDVAVLAENLKIKLRKYAFFDESIVPHCALESKWNSSYFCVFTRNDFVYKACRV